ncbi:putative Type IV pilus assembly PilZ [Desulfamplus magnetovallimortis]|uniref:Putative Type IV pilus assembly PilZ n=1 Tax=Desulfamplus magnetovallimortis TaxID=1246637 RepID=A0A1W1HH54_9BACT|nr:PilZ domain-containing protein [Desulfamplus magnetovallimortis]SLM31776.1 putative Type IV pilus assembly PilZ [Desulfamplus magnetovallimortis]
MLKSVTLYASDHEDTMFVCKECGFQKKIDPSLFSREKKDLKIKCRCGQPYEIHFEFRERFRKDVSLVGMCTLEKNGAKYDVFIKNISMKGIAIDMGFVNKKNFTPFEHGDIMEIEFTLDNLKADFIRKRCVVRTISDNMIGAEFVDGKYNDRLGFYLM